MPILPVPAAMQSSSRGFYPKTLNGSLRFNDDDTAYIARTFAVEGNRDVWTFSCWVKRCNLGTNQTLFSSYFGASTAGSFQFRFGTGDQLEVVAYTTYYRKTTAVYRDPSAWYHIVLHANTASDVANDRWKLWVNGEQVTDFATLNNPAKDFNTGVNYSTQHTIGAYDNGLGDRFDGYMAEAFFIDSTAYSASDFGETKNGVWVPKNVTSTDFTMGTNGFHLPMTDDTEVEAFNTVLYKGTGNHNNSVTGVGFSPDLVWIKDRDAANHHVLMDSVRGGNRQLNSSSTGVEQTQYDLTEAIESDGFSVGDNVAGTGATNISGNDYVAWCWDAGSNNASTGHSSVTYTGNSGTQTIKGLPFTPDLVWIKSRTLDIAHGIFDTVRGFGVSGGTNTAIGSNRTDAEGNGNGNVTGVVPNGFLLAPGSSGSNPHHLTNLSGYDYVAWCWDAGDSDPASNTDGSITSTVKASTTSGFSIVKWTGNGTSGATIGHGLSQAPDFILVKPLDTANSWATYDSTNGATNYMALQSTQASSADSTRWNNTEPTSSVFSVGNHVAVNDNGNDHIAYCWHDVTGKQKFGSYTGGTNGQKITTGFRPGFLLIKRTSSSGDSWALFDSSRSPFNDGSTEYVFANSSAVEASASNRGVNFVSDGFELVGTDGFINQSGTYIYAAFAGSYSDYITDVNTDGTVDSRVKASDTTGFSVVSYTGTGANATVGHGLSSAPDLVIVKSRTGTGGWITWTNEFSGDQYLTLQTTNAVASQATIWNSTVPSSTTFSVGTHTATNGSGQDYIAYCWTETTGVSKFGTYTGNGSTTGPSVTTGFKPAFVMIKRTNSTGNWIMIDATRDVTNERDKYISANASSAEGSGAYNVDFDATGFQIKYADPYGDVNASGSTYIYAAFADTRDAAFWLDQSSNDNDWQPVNLDHNDTVLDSPTDNYCTWNPIGIQYGGTYTGTFSEGNLKAATSGNASHFFGTMALPSTGKFYWEVTVISLDTARTYVGVVAPAINTGHPASNSASYAFIHKALWSNTGYAMTGTETNGTTSGQYSSYTTGDVLRFAVDMDTGKFFIGKNGTWQNSASPTAGTGQIVTLDLNQTWLPYAGYNSTFEVNFGQQPFKYSPPEQEQGMAYLPLSTSNLPDPGVDPNAAEEPRDYFETFLYTGNGTGLQVGDVIKKPADTTTISNSLIFNDDDSAYLSRSQSDGDRKTWTWSGWVKRANIGVWYNIFGSGTNSSNQAGLSFTSSDYLSFIFEVNNNGYQIVSNATYKDTSRWYHIVAIADTTEPVETATDRLRLYVDGIRVTSLQSSSYPSTDYQATMNSSSYNAYLGRARADGTNYADGYMAEVHFVDGTAHEPTDFGNFDANGIWIPKTVTAVSDYGTNGYHLDFSDNTSTTTLGEDQTANGNDWTLNNFATTDQVDDSPTDNIPYNISEQGGGYTISEGNLKTSVSTDNRHARTSSPLPPTGKWYWEAEIVVTNSNHGISIVNRDFPLTVANIIHVDSVTYHVAGGQIYAEGTTAGTYSTAPVNDVVGVAFDADTGRIWFRNDSGWLNSGDPAAGTGYVHTVSTWGQEDWFPAVISHGSANKQTFFNFGQRTFAHTVPTGFSAMTENNITVDDQNLESPDLVWIKVRDSAYHHAIADSVRGVTSQLSTSSTNAESTQAGSGVVSFNRNGFTLGTESAGTGTTNSAGLDYVAWCWKAGGTAVSNTDGSITSTVSANTTSGFSIVTYTGNGTTNATIGHGLSQAPEVVIQKNIGSTSTQWRIDHFPSNVELYFDTGTNQSDYWNNSVSSSVITLNKSDSTYQNYNNNTYVAYCFHSVEGFSKFGSYTGNGSADGPFIYTGFKPTFFMWKPTSVTGSWATYDAKRSTYNTIQTGLWPNLSSAEADFGSTYAVDFVSNGIKLRGAGGGFNGSGQPHIYMAFAETPFKYSVAR